MYSEEDYIQLSAIQHFFFCPRQCALIHIEQQWVENVFTAEGRLMHAHVHASSSANKKEIKIEYGTALYSSRLGLSGKADVIEFSRDENGKLVPFPVEYKRGKPKPNDCDKVQLCAQALCLEEMLGVPVPEGTLYYGKTRRRLTVEFSKNLRKETIDAVRSLHDFIKEGKTPAPIYTKKCKWCSFIDICLPETIHRKMSVRDYIKDELKQI